MPLFLIAFFSLLYPFLSDLSDTNNNNKRFVISLPFDRSEIVLSNYVKALLFLIMNLTILYLLSIFMPSYKSVNFESIVLTLLVSILIISLYYPLLFTLGIKRVIYAIVGIILGCFILAPYIANLLTKNKLDFIMEMSESGAFIIIVLLATTLIFFLSIKYSTFITSVA
ncbi:ABC-2 transporter permease [Virgibacillus pantothenticus]|uniref:ABC-2 transporter permease n=1 Tax=Virgibacillus pantothenticus TaxID=1473 RepID=UPI001BCECA9C